MPISVRGRKRIWDLLIEVVHRVDGEYSGIPECCVEAYVGGRRARPFFQSKDEAKKRAFQYVPCDECWEAGRAVRLRLNGNSPIAERLLGLMDGIDGVRAAATGDEDESNVSGDGIE